MWGRTDGTALLLPGLHGEGQRGFIVEGRVRILFTHIHLASEMRKMYRTDQQPKGTGPMVDKLSHGRLITYQGTTVECKSQN